MTKRKKNSTIGYAVFILGSYVIFALILHGKYAEIDKAELEASISEVREGVLKEEIKRLHASVNSKVDYKELLVTAMTLFGSAAHPGETFLDENVEAQSYILDSAINRSEHCGTSITDEFLKWGCNKSKSKCSAQYSVWENGGPAIGYADIERFSVAMSQAEVVLSLNKDGLNELHDSSITHYHQSSMKNKPGWSKEFDRVVSKGGNTFYAEKNEKGSYCSAFVPETIPPVMKKVKPVRRKVRKSANANTKDAGIVGRLRAMKQKERKEPK